MDYKFEKGKFTEEELESAFIELFKEQEYEYVSGESLHRKFTDILLYDDLNKFLLSKYPDITDSELKRAISIIDNISSTPLYEGSKETYKKLSEGFDLIREDSSKIALHIEFFDFENEENNIFKVVNQFSIEDVSNRRPDLIVFVNGIPISIFEFKTAVEENKTIHDAYEQINVRYARDIPKLLKYSILSVISDGANTKLGNIFSPYKFYYSWNKANDDDKVSNGISSLFTMIKGVYAKDRLLKIFRDFVFYPDDSKKEELIVCRYPQFFASYNMLESLKKHKKPEGDSKGGIYFGATGCGKTYTMLFLSRLLMLREKEKFNNPTIIIITDREDLNSQTSKLFVTSKSYLHDNNVRSIESRKDMSDTLSEQESGGVYITTIQKFCESTGLLSNRSNIICISDEAHRTQTGVGSKIKKTEEGLYTTYGFAHYLRESFPNAVYCGFTGTPIDEAISVFGEVVDSYTMKESSDDEITVRISYEPRLARVQLSENDVKEIQEYYDECARLGSSEEQIESSQKAMSRMSSILGHPERIRKLARDLVNHYEKICNEKPLITQKAMIVCNDRKTAHKLYKEIINIRQDWSMAKKCEDKTKFSASEYDSLVAVPKINLVATRNDNDEPDLYNLCGTKEHRKFLDEQFKNEDSNFKVAIVVDMWITGFDVPSLAVMYIDKPLQKHTLIQTISRVNRLFDGKEKGLIVDYIGIKNEMMQAIKLYGDSQESPIDEIQATMIVFKNYLKLVGNLFVNFNSSRFHNGSPLERLQCLNDASEYIQTSKEVEDRFMGLSRRLKSAYEIVFPSGEITNEEINIAQFYIAVRSIIFKQTKGNAPDADIMNQVVEEMVKNAISCNGIENIFDENDKINFFDSSFTQQLISIKLPITKFNALMKLLKRAIKEYGKVNRIKSLDFDEKLKKVIEEYNNRDNTLFTNQVVGDFVNNLSNELIKILKDLDEDKSSFEIMGISFQEKSYYDILIKIRDIHEFEYPDDKCLELAKKIKDLVEDKTQYADFFIRSDIRSQLNMDLTVLLYENGYPPKWDDEVFDKIMQQTENMKKYE